MFEKLDQIDWSKLKHAYGPASDVPDLLRSLASEDKEDREEAMYELCGNIWHQGTVYEATAPAVPFLLELLESPTVLGKEEILFLLAHLANGSSYHNVHQNLPLLKNQSSTAEWQEQIPIELGWVREATNAVKAGEPLYLGLLSHSEGEVREAAVYLLASLDKPAPRRAGLIWERHEEEKEARVRASLVFGFGILAERNDLNRSLLLHALTSESGDAARLAATLGLVRLAPNQVPREGVAILLEAVAEPNRFDLFGESLWGEEDGIEKLLCDHLARLEGESALAGEEGLVKLLPAQELPQALTTAEALLALAFNKAIPRDATFASLTEQQQRILRALAKSPNVWVQTLAGEPAASVKTSMLVRSCGLPGKVNEFLECVTAEEGTFNRPGRAEHTPKLAERLKKFFGFR
jgi:hypothetical protein